MIRNGEASLDASAERLRRAVEALEAKLAGLEGQAPPAADSGVQAELREARLRERALEAAAAEASAVLGRAAERIRVALDEDPDAEEAPSLGPDGDPARSPANDPLERGASLDHLSDDQTDLHPTPARES